MPDEAGGARNEDLHLLCAVYPPVASAGLHHLCLVVWYRHNLQEGEGGASRINHGSAWVTAQIQKQGQDSS